MITKAIHPSIYLKEYLDETNMALEDFSNKTAIDLNQLQSILAKQEPITLEIAHKLAKFIGTSVEIWLNLQSKYDLYKKD